MHYVRVVMQVMSLFFLIATSNRLNDNDEGYGNITVARHLSLPDLEMLQFVHNQITPGKQICHSSVNI